MSEDHAKAQRRKGRRGMTLIEVIVALAILIVMATVTYEVLDTSLEIREVLADRDDANRAARVTLSRLRREFQLAFLTKHLEAINTYETVFVGLDENPDRVYMATLAHQRLYRDSRESDQTEVTVWAEPARDGGKGFVLYHREAPRVDEEPDEDGVIFPIAYNVRTFNLRYLDPRTNEWVDEWDTRNVDTANRLPRAVEIALVVIAPDPDDEHRTVDIPYITTVILEYGDELQKSAFNPNVPPPLEEE